jgi:antitoxin (DNA-binding transcriptional repressor) of toxin-antitoxin stability system
MIADNHSPACGQPWAAVLHAATGTSEDYNGHMKKTNISTLKRDLSRYIDYVRKGGTVRVFDRQTPVADLVPMVGRGKASDETTEAMIDRLERQGSVIRRGTGRFDPAVLRRPPVKTRRSVVAAVLEERREGR